MPSKRVLKATSTVAIVALIGTFALSAFAG
jgi:hypothetical protein